MNDSWGKAAQQWITWGVGISMLVGGAVKTLLTGDSPPEVYWGVACIVAGVGNEIAKRIGAR